MSGLKPDCEACRLKMPGSDQVQRCRHNGLPTSAANAADCRRFQDAAVVPADRVWFDDKPGQVD